MNCFHINHEFNDYKDFLQQKRQYEVATNSILSITRSENLKGTGDFVQSMVYQRINLECKAGKERPCKSKGIRKSSTYKKQCPFEVKISLVKNKLTVKKSVTIHKNHLSDEMTFKHYPENLRLNDKENIEARKMIGVNGNKRIIKAELSKNRDSPVPLKVLHNLQTKMRKEKQNLGPNNELIRLIEAMKTIPNATVRVIENDKEEFVGIFFQDQRMSQMYEKYPEVMFYDATNKMNNRNLPLFIQSCITGNGETEMVSLYICTGENRDGIGAMIDVFKECNPAWKKTKVIIGDKDFVDRDVYTEKLGDAVLQICLFHVLCTFNREINTSKRNITKQQRLEALEILEKITYSRSSEKYDIFYSQLVDLELPDVIDYFNSNWHNIKEQWTLWGRNQHANYLNATNNRTESLNKTIKMVGDRYANLDTFFENLSTSVFVIESEKDIQVMKSDMKIARVRFNDSVLERYNDFLTPFIFQKVEEQYKLMSLVNFSLIDQNGGTVASLGAHIVSADKCSCEFNTCMKLPCRHMFKFLTINNLDPFVPEVCAMRWSKHYYDESHPALNANIEVMGIKPVYVTTIRVPEERERFKKAAKLTSKMSSLASGMSTGRYTYFLNKMKNICDEMTNGQPNPQQENNDIVVDSVTGGNDLSMLTVAQRNLLTSLINSFSATQSSTSENPPPTSTESGHRIEGVRSNTELATTSVSDFTRIKLPQKLVPVGRPKGSTTKKVIGTKRRGPKRKGGVPNKMPKK